MINELKLLVKFIAVAAFFLGGAATAFCQTPVLQWQKTYGGINQEYGYASAKLNNNLYVHGGRSTVPFTNNIYPFLLFTNAGGDSLYSQAYPAFPTGKITGIAANEDGTFVVCGSYSIAATTGAIFLIKFNQVGGIVWQKSFSINSAGNTQKVIRVPDGYLVIGDVLVDVIKTDLDGNLKWQKVYGGNQASGQDLTPLPDGSYLATGWTIRGSAPTASAFHKLNYWLLKLRPNGDTVFTKVLGNAANFEMGYAAAPTMDGGIAVAGAYVANVPQTKRQGQVLKLDSLFNLQWEMKVMPNGGDYEVGCEFFNIQPTVAGDYIVAGQNVQTNVLPTRGYIASISPPAPTGGSATINWSQFYETGDFRSMMYESNSSALLSGTNAQFNPGGSLKNVQILALKLTNLGQSYKPDFCAKAPVSAYSYLVKPDSIIITNSHKSKAGTRYGVISKWEYLFGDGNSFITYDSLQAKRVAHKYSIPTALMYGNPVKLIVTNNTFCTDTLTLYPFGGAPTGITEATAARVEVKLYPSPMQQESILELKNYTGKEKLHLEVTDMLGRKMALPNKQLKTNQWALHRGSLSKGLYVYRLVSGNKVVAQGKIVILDR